MARFTYLVTVTVPEDEDIALRDQNVSDFYWGESEFDNETGESTGLFSPQTRANIALAERLGCDEDYGFDYTVEYGDAQ